jgi:uncharacterized Zn finger protein (UPF0148 family)
MREIQCPVCETAKLDAPGHCPACGTIRLFKVEQPRVIRATYERKVWARNAEQAIQVAEQGTAWPASYDERRDAVEQGEWRAKDVTETGVFREDGGYADAEESCCTS